jgi:LemA protein
MFISIALAAIFLISMVMGLSLFIFYNRLVVRRNEFKNAFAQIDVQLNRRYDLIPNLVKTAKGYMAHESQTLEKVISARNEAHRLSQAAASNPGDPELIKKLSGAEGILGQSLSSLKFTMEAYPDLKADKTIAILMEELTSTENKVAFSRQFYNDSVMDYNNAREVFPSNLVANMFNFRPAQPFVIENPAVRQPVSVDF